MLKAQTHTDDRWPTGTLGLDEVRCCPGEHPAAAGDWPSPPGGARGSERVLLMTLEAAAC